METIIMALVIIFDVTIILLVEKFMHRHLPSQEEVDDQQKILDDIDVLAKSKYNLDWKHDALTEIMSQRKNSESFTLILSGMFLVLFLLVLVFFTSLSLLVIGVISTSSFILICYGLIKISDSKRAAVGLLGTVIILAFLSILVFYNYIRILPYGYFYLCGLLLLIGLLIVSKKK